MSSGTLPGQPQQEAKSRKRSIVLIGILMCILCLLWLSFNFARLNSVINYQEYVTTFWKFGQDDRVWYDFCPLAFNYAYTDPGKA